VQVPRFWLVGFDEAAKPLTPAQVLEDVSEEHARKTITVDPHPHLATSAASIHPCRCVVSLPVLCHHLLCRMTILVLLACHVLLAMHIVPQLLAPLRCAMLRSHAEVMKKLVDTLVAGGTDFQLEQCARGVSHCRANDCITAAHCCLIDCLLLEIIRMCSTEPRDCHFRQPQCSSRSGHVELPRGGCLCVCWLHHR
jgi:Autophagocytosis associated protein, active-site domain